VPQTILLVEDNPSLHRLVERMLRNLSYDVIAASTGAAAVQACQKHQGHIDLVVIDVFLPDIKGPELARQLHTMRPELKVLYVSGSHEVLEKGVLASREHFLQKPFSVARFSEQIRLLLGNDRP
jgi:two-component system, cell cycle sensor histidine kinase and response regulator CckA